MSDLSCNGLIAKRPAWLRGTGDYYYLGNLNLVNENLLNLVEIADKKKDYETQVSNKRYLRCLNRLSSELNCMIRGGGRIARALTNSAS